MWMGLPVRLMSVLFNIVTGIAIALMIPAAGSLLVSTIMILPAAIGMKIGQTFKSVIFWAIGIWFDWYAFWYLYFLLLGNTSQCHYYPYLYRLLGLVSIFEPLLKAE